MALGSRRDSPFPASMRIWAMRLTSSMSFLLARATRSVRSAGTVLLAALYKPLREATIRSVAVTGRTYLVATTLATSCNWVAYLNASDGGTATSAFGLAVEDVVLNWAGAAVENERAVIRKMTGFHVLRIQQRRLWKRFA